MTIKRKSTIYDLAELADVSASTVSAVLNGNWRERRIAEATAQQRRSALAARTASASTARRAACARAARG